MMLGPVVETESGPVRGLWRGPGLLNYAADPSQLLDDPAAHIDETRPEEAEAGPGPNGEGGTRPAAFLGIPYAQAPVRELRFAAPRPRDPWSVPLDCTQYGPTPVLETAEGSLVPEPAFPGQDILNLNVFTPNLTPQTPAPVLVYIHGGGFTGGSPSSPWYDGRSFSRDGVVSVNISYRLGLEGFGWIEGAPANRGVLDWLAALEWVQQNIHAFGGDPQDVTIAGQSAGGGAVLTLLGMPKAQGLFRKAWVISGAAADIPMRSAQATARELGKIAGVAPTVEGFSSLSRRQVWEAEQELQRRALRPSLSLVMSGPTKGLSFGPVIDGETVKESTIAAILGGIGAEKHLLIGATEDEFTSLAGSIPAFATAVPPRLLLALWGLRGRAARRYLRGRAARHQKTSVTVGRFVTDFQFRAPALEVAQARGNGPTWLYSFEWTGAKERYAIHCSDVPFWFDCLDQPYVNWLLGHALPIRLAKQMHAAAVDFVVTGNPGWPRAHSEEPIAMIFDGSAEERLEGGAYSAEEELLRLK